jgi:hypothetical protein
MIYSVINGERRSSSAITLTCPGCGQRAKFIGLSINDVYDGQNNRIFGVRRCPDDTCATIVYVIVHGLKGLLDSYPPVTIQYSKERIPSKIVAAFDEAIICRSHNCLVASAIMIRKTLEEICADKKAEGKTLYNRIEALKSKIVISKELFEGLQALRLLGNDAAHLEAQTYEDIGIEEIDISIQVTIKILDSVYQHDILVDKLKGLQKPKV